MLCQQFLGSVQCFVYIVAEVLAAKHFVEVGLQQLLLYLGGDAGEDDLFAESPVSALAYFSFTEDRDELRNVFSTSFLSLLSPLIEGYDYCPLIAKVGKNKKEPFVSVRLVKDL